LKRKFDEGPALFVGASTTMLYPVESILRVNPLIEDVVAASHVFKPPLTQFTDTCITSLPSHPRHSWTHVSAKVFQADGEPVGDDLRVHVRLCIRSTYGLFSDMVVLDQDVSPHKAWIPLRWPIPAAPLSHHLLVLLVTVTRPSGEEGPFEGAARIRALSIDRLVESYDQVCVNSMGGPHLWFVTGDVATDVYDLVTYPQLLPDNPRRVTHCEWTL